MLSRNNWDGFIKKQVPNRQRFTLKKLTIGVASVLIGFTFMGISASADTTNVTGQPVNNGQAVSNGSSSQSNGLEQSADQTTSQQGAASANENQSQLLSTLPTNLSRESESSNESTTRVTVHPDGSIDVITTPSKPSIADRQTPQGGTITVAINHVLDDFDANDAITNHVQLHDVSSYTWKNAPDTSVPGLNKDGVVTVTYTDNSTDDVPVKVNVTYSATYPVSYEGLDIYRPNDNSTATKDKMPTTTVRMPVGTITGYRKGYQNDDQKEPFTDPNGTNITIDNDGKVTVKVRSYASRGIFNVPVIVTYIDGSEETVYIPVSITGDEIDPDWSDTKDADKYEPRGQNVKTIIGRVPDASEGIKNKNDLPAETTYAWSQDPNVYGKGDHPAVVIVTYPDGSTDYVPITVTVKNQTSENNVKFQDTHYGWTQIRQTGVTTTNGNLFNDDLGVKLSVDNARSVKDKMPIAFEEKSAETFAKGTTMTHFAADPVNVHRTSADFTPDVTNSKFNTITFNSEWDPTSHKFNKQITYKLNDDHTEFVKTADPNDRFAASALKYTWMSGYTANTNFE